MKPLAISFLIALSSTIVLAGEETCGIKSGSRNADHVDREQFANTYRNFDYGYSVIIPSGLSGEAGNHPLLQNHGFTILLSERPLAYIYVTAWYDVLETETSPNLERRNLAWLKKTADVRIIRVSNLPISLASTPARRYVARIKCKEHPGVYVKDETLVVWNGIEYTVGLLAPEKRYKSDVTILNRILDSWAWIQK